MTIAELSDVHLSLACARLRWPERKAVLHRYPPDHLWVMVIERDSDVDDLYGEYRPLRNLAQAWDLLMQMWRIGPTRLLPAAHGAPPAVSTAHSLEQDSCESRAVVLAYVAMRLAETGRSIEEVIPECSNTS